MLPDVLRSRQNKHNESELIIEADSSLYRGFPGFFWFDLSGSKFSAFYL